MNVNGKGHGISQSCGVMQSGEGTEQCHMRNTCLLERNVSYILYNSGNITVCVRNPTHFYSPTPHVQCHLFCFNRRGNFSIKHITYYINNFIG